MGLPGRGIAFDLGATLGDDKTSRAVFSKY